MISLWLTQYADGYRAGRCDRLVGRFSRLSYTCDYYLYRLGYADGVSGHEYRSAR